MLSNDYDRAHSKYSSALREIEKIRDNIDNEKTESILSEDEINKLG